MKKRLLAILMATAMSMSLIACGGGEEEAATKEVATEEAVEEEAAVEEVADVEYTEEQQAFVDEYLQLCDDYDAAIVVLEGIPELSENQELVDVMNTLSEAIIDVADICADPESSVVDFGMCDFCLDFCIKKDAEVCKPLFLQPFQRIQEISGAYIDGFLNTLCYFYPDYIGDFFKRYIAALKQQSAEYIRVKR